MTLQELVVDLRLNAEDFARGLESAMSTWESFGSSLMKIGAGLSAALTIPIVGVGQAAIKMGTQLQQAEIAFGTMLGSAELAGAYLEELKQFAAATPFEFAELVPAAKRLMALGFAAEETIPMLKALGNAAAGLGGGAPLIQRLGLALGQMRAKAKVSAEEMRQLAEAGIPAWEMLAKAMGKTTAELMKLSEKGQVSAAAAIPLLIAGINEKFGGLMEGFMATAMGQYSNVKDQLGFVLADIGKALLPIAALLIEKFALPAVSALRDLAAWFSKLNDSTKGTIIALAGLLAAIGPVTLALGGMGYMYAPLIAGAARVSQALLPMFANIASAIQTGTVGGLALAEKQLLGFVGVAVPALAAVGIAFAAWQIPAVREKMLALWDVMQKFYTDTIAPFISDLTKIGEAFVETAATAVESGLKKFLEELDLLMKSDSAQKLSASLRDLGSAVAELSGVFKPLWEVLGPIIEGLVRLRMVILAFDLSVLTANIQAVTSGIKMWWEAIGEGKLAEFIDDVKQLTETVKNLKFFFLQGVEAWVYGWGEMKKMHPELVMLAKAFEFMYGKMVESTDKWAAAAMAGHKTAAKAASSALDQMTAAFKASEEVYAKAVKALSEFDKATGKAMGTQEAAAEADVKMQQAKAALVAQMDKEGVGIKTLYDATIKSQSAYNATIVAMEKLKAAHGAGAESAKALATAQANVGTAHEGVVKAQIALTQAGARLGLTLADIKKQYDKVIPAAQTLEDQEKALKEAVKAATIEYKLAQRAQKDSLDLYDGSIESIARLAAATGDEKKALEAAKVSYDRVKNASLALQAAEDKLDPGKVAERRSKASEENEKRMDKETKEGLAWVDAQIKHAEAIAKADADVERSKEHLAGVYVTAYQKMAAAAAEQIDVTGFQKATPYGESDVAEALAYAKKMGAEYPKLLFGPLEAYQAKVQISPVQSMLQDAPGVTAFLQQQANIQGALKATGVVSDQILRQQSTDADKAFAAISAAYNSINAVTGRRNASDRELLEAMRASDEARLKIASSPAEAQAWAKKIKSIDEQLSKLAGTYKGFWAQLGTELKQFLGQFASQMGAGLFTAILGKDRKAFNKGLDQQETDLTKSLADRTKDWEQYQVDVKVAQGDAEKKYRDTLANERASLDKSLADRVKEYDDFAKEVDASISELRTNYARELAGTLSDLKSSLNDAGREYQDYVADINRQLSETRQSHYDELAKTLADLDKGLADQAQSYREYVNDVNKSLSRLGQDYQENLSDETKSTEQAIADRRKEYGRDAQDAQKQLDELFKAGKTENDKEVKDLRQSMARKSEDLGAFEKEKRDALTEYTDDAQRQLTRETDDINAELAKRQEEYVKFVAETQKNRQEAVQANSTDLAKEEAALFLSLQKRAEEWAKFQAENSAASAKAVLDSNVTQAKEEADLYASLARKREELSKFTAEIAEQWRVVQEQALAALVAEQGDLAKQLDAERLLYNTFVADTIAKLEELKEAHRSIWNDIGSMTVAALEMMGQAVMQFVTKYLMDSLLETLTKRGGVKDTLASVANQIKDLKGQLTDLITGGAGGAGAAGAAGSVPGATPGAAGGTATAGTGLMGIIGVVAGVVDAISSVVSNFQFAHMNTTLKLIEHEVRYSQIHLLNLLEKANEFWPTGKSILDYMWSFQSKILTMISSSLESILNVLKISIPTVQSQAATGPVTVGPTLEGLLGSAAEAVDEFGRVVTETVAAFTLPVNDLGNSVGLAGAAMADLAGETVVAAMAVAPLAPAFNELSDTVRDAAKYSENLAGTFKQVGDDIVSDFDKLRLAELEKNNPFKGTWMPPPMYVAPGPGPIAPTDTPGDAVNAINTQGNNLVQVLFDLPEAMGYEVSRGINTQGMRVIASLAALTAVVSGGDNAQGMRISGDALAVMGGIGQGGLSNIQGVRMGSDVKPFPSISPWVSTGPDTGVPIVIRELTVRSEIDGRQVGNAVISNLALVGVRL